MQNLETMSHGPCLTWQRVFASSWETNLKLWERDTGAVVSVEHFYNAEQQIQLGIVLG